MLKTTLTKIKRASLYTFIPKILQGNLKPADGRITTRTYEALSVLKKSTDSTQDEDNEIQMRIIEKCFAPKTPLPENSNETLEMKLHGGEPKYVTETPNERCQRLIEQSFVNDNNKIEKTNEIGKKSNITLEDVRAQATTATLAEEQLTQKIESIDETSVVEAGVPKVGFNITPKALGEKIESLNFAHSTIGGPECQIDYDEVAKRCLGAPLDEIDERLLNELRKISKNEPPTHKDVVPLDLARTHSVKNLEAFLNKSKQKLLYDEQIKYRYNKIDNALAKETGYVKAKSDLEKTCIVSNPLNELPAAINPYEARSFPFYEHNLGEELSDEIEELAIIKPIHETDLNETETKAATTEQVKNKISKLDIGALGLPEASSFTESISKYSDVLKGTVTIFTTNTNNPNDIITHPNSMHQQEEEIVIPNTAISGTLPTLNNKRHGARNAQNPDSTNTAISAHQEFDEFSIIKVSAVKETTYIQNLKTREQAIKSHPYIYPICHMLFETQLKPQEKPEETPNILEQFETKMMATEIPVENPNLPLSEMMERVRERSRLEMCHDYILKANIMKKPSCLPPLDNQGKPKDRCSPPACQPKPKTPESKCPPPKKDPCAKFITLLGVMLREACYMWSDIRYCRHNYTPIYDVRRNFTTKSGFRATSLLEIPRFGHKLGSDALGEMMEKHLEARSFDPWIPIPSWPPQKKEKKRPFICPKDGCKMIPPPNFHGPCKENPCRSFPKRTFAPSILTQPFIA